MSISNDDINSSSSSASGKPGNMDGHDSDGVDPRGPMDAGDSDGQDSGDSDGQDSGDSDGHDR